MIKKPYPRMLYPHQTLDGSKRIVQDALDEEKFTGIRMNADGTPFIDPYADSGSPVPPTLELVMSAGYSREKAEEIVRLENHRQAMGYPPYGTNEEPPAAPPEAAPQATPEVLPEIQPTAEESATPPVDAVPEPAKSRRGGK